MSLSRRQFIRNVSLAGGALTLGVTLTGCSDTPLAPAAPGTFRPNAFVSIDSQGQVLVQIHRAEMGQGVVTGIITLIAEELDLAPADVSYEMAPVHKAYANPEYYIQITGGSTSMRVDYDNLRLAGATARAMLLQAASDQSGIDIGQLHVDQGQIFSRDGMYSSEFGPLVELASKLDVPQKVPLKSPEDFKLIGQFDQRLDAAGKVDGSAAYAIDKQLENCLTAVVIRSPGFGGTLLDFDASEALAQPGVVDVVAITNGLAVVAQGYWYARQGAAKVQANFSETDNPLHSSDLIRTAMEETLEQGPFSEIRQERARNIPTASVSVEADYFLPFLAHVTMEPQNATAHVTEAGCELWVGSQAPDVARAAAAKALGIPTESVTVNNHLMGGGFGRRAIADEIVEVVEIAAKFQQPVKLIWSREDDTQHDFYRPAMAGRLSAKVDDSGNIHEWNHRIVGPSVNQHVFSVLGKAMVPSWLPSAAPAIVGDIMASTDFTSVEGAKELPYGFNGVEVQYSNLPTAVPLGYWRSVGHSHNAFVVESFVDELAHAAGTDPLAFRLKYLKGDSRERRVLEKVAELASWGSPPEGRFQGIAVHESFHSVVAEIAEVSIQNGKPKIEAFYCAVDCGLAINPDIVKDQMAGGIAFGLSAALYGEITVENGAVQQSNFHDYPVLRHHEMPLVHVVIMPSDASPTGVGEPGTPPAAPALANALFAATGIRHRELPLRFS